jgi:hypothetical protein
MNKWEGKGLNQINNPQGNQGSPEDIERAKEILEAQPYQKDASRVREMIVSRMEALHVKGFLEGHVTRRGSISKEDMEKYGPDVTGVLILEGVLNDKEIRLKKIFIEGGMRSHKEYAYEAVVQGIPIDPENAKKLFKKYEPVAIDPEEEKTFTTAGKNERVSIHAKKMAEDKKDPLDGLL